MTRTDVVRKLCGRLIAMAREADADALVTGCPMCHANLDTRQGEIAKEGGENHPSRFLFYGINWIGSGHRDVKKWLHRHITDPRTV